MPSYSNLVYAGGYYGQQSRLSFSVQPFTSVAIDYDKVLLTWAPLPNPDGEAFNAVRLVRNQVTFPETQEDGLILWEEDQLTGPFSKSTFVDGYDNLLDENEHNDSPLIGGRFAYYRMWLRKDDNVWYEAGDTYLIIPQDHGATAFAGTTAQTTHDKVMDLLPKVYTTATQSPIDNVDPESTLYRFLKGFSLTLDELLTYADVLKPNYSGLSTPPQVVSLQAQQLGLPMESSLGLRAMKHLVREAVYLHNNKGTLLGVQTLAESLTGFAPTVTQTRNLMLSIQDSTFYKGVGNWTPVGNCNIVSAANIPIVTGIEGCADLTYTGKVTVSTTGAKLSNGNLLPKTRGIPVLPETNYEVSFQHKFDSGSTASLSLTATWYDYLGTAIDSEVVTGLSSSSTWALAENTFESPAEATYLGIDITFPSTGTYYIDMVQVAQENPDSLNAPYEEPRGVNVFLAPSKVNLVKNPSFDELNALWDITDDGNELVDSTFAHAFGTSQMLESTTNTDALTQYTTESDAGIPAGQFYTASLYAKTVSGTEDFELTLTATSGLDTVTETTGTVTLTDEWQRIHVSLFVPSTYDETTFLTIDFVGEETTGNVIHLDGVQLEASYLPTDYFDGEFPDVYGAMWAGTENESVSYLYPNRHVKIPRLVANLAEYMPIGTPFAISTYAGLEYIGIS
jgi:phage tail-like protein